MEKYYTGIGSRKVPQDIYEVMYNFAAKAAELGYTLRSGGADGSDEAFEKGCDSVQGAKEIYLPWKGFNKRKSVLYCVTQEALNIASKIHPAWNKLNFAVRQLHGRNVYQCLGLDLKTLSKFLVCWTEGGKDIGGTRTAIVLAKQNRIPVYNLGNKKHLDKILGYL